MSVDYNPDEVIQMFKKKQEKLLTKTGFQGVVLAAINSRVDTGLSQNSKKFKFVAPDKIWIEAPVFYDLYLERRYGIMAKTQDEIIPYMARFEGEIFG
jgi:hypothetical protein